MHVKLTWPGCSPDAASSISPPPTATPSVALAASGTGDVVDAAVVVGALHRAEVVVTSDPQDLRQIADALGAPLTVHVL